MHRDSWSARQVELGINRAAQQQLARRVALRAALTRGGRSWRDCRAAAEETPLPDAWTSRLPRLAAMAAQVARSDQAGTHEDLDQDDWQ